MTDVRALLEATTTIAVVGCSTQPHKAAHRIPAQMLDRGFTVVPVNPTTDEILGQPAYPDLASIPTEIEIDLVDVFRPAPETPEVVRQAVDRGARAVWLQLGIAHPEARRLAEEAGLGYVEDLCLGVEAARLGAKGPGAR